MRDSPRGGRVALEWRRARNGCATSCLRTRTRGAAEVLRDSGRAGCCLDELAGLARLRRGGLPVGVWLGCRRPVEVRRVSGIGRSSEVVPESTSGCGGAVDRSAKVIRPVGEAVEYEACDGLFGKDRVAVELGGLRVRFPCFEDPSVVSHGPEDASRVADQASANASLGQSRNLTHLVGPKVCFVAQGGVVPFAVKRARDRTGGGAACAWSCPRNARCPATAR